jgi:hypothetical protein
MRWTRRRREDDRRLSRTAKSCGPGPRRWGQAGGSKIRRVAKKPGSPGRARSKPLKPLRGESWIAPVGPVVNLLVWFFTLSMRGFCNGPWLVNPFLRHPVAGYLLLSGIGAWPSPNGVLVRNRSANLWKGVIASAMHRQLACRPDLIHRPGEGTSLREGYCS